MKTTTFNLLLAALVGLAAAPTHAQDTTAEKSADETSGSLPACIHSVDASFNDYVNLDRLGFAWQALNAEMMTDAVLQLAEGERVLQRKHKAIDTVELAKAAVQIAAQNNDKDSLARLAKFAQSRGDEKLSTQITAAQKMSGASRGAANIMIGIGMVTPSMLEAYEGIDAGIRRSGIFSDTVSLEALKKLIDQLKESEFDGTLAADLEKKIALATKMAGPARGDSGSGKTTQEALDKLASGKRSADHWLAAGALAVVGGLAYQDAQYEQQTQTRRENMMYGAITGRGPYGQPQVVYQQPVRQQPVYQQPVYAGGTPGFYQGNSGGPYEPDYSQPVPPGHYRCTNPRCPIAFHPY